jgi:hypothetical protein
VCVIYIPGGGGSVEEGSSGKRVTDRETAAAVADLPRQSQGTCIKTLRIYANTEYMYAVLMFETYVLTAAAVADSSSSCRPAAPKSRQSLKYTHSQKYQWPSMFTT